MTGRIDPERAITILIADDHQVVLESVREIIETDETLEIVATAGTVGEAIRLGRSMQPDVAILDVNMPDGGGWEVARSLREACPGIRLIAYSSFDTTLVTKTMMAAGISAFVVKGSDIGRLLDAVHGENLVPVAKGSAPFARQHAVVSGAESSRGA